MSNNCNMYTCLTKRAAVSIHTLCKTGFSVTSLGGAGEEECICDPFGLEDFLPDSCLLTSSCFCWWRAISACDLGTCVRGRESGALAVGLMVRDGMWVYIIIPGHVFWVEENGPGQLPVFLSSTPGTYHVTHECQSVSERDSQD